jgi:ATP-dependent Clp protease ATP-binding subunit ClpA
MKRVPLDAEAMAAFREAEAEARVRRHLEVTPAHLLATLVRRGRVAHLLEGRDLDPGRLSDELDAMFSSFECAGGYRDGVEVDTSVALEDVLLRANGARGIEVWRAVSSEELLDAVLGEPDLRHLLQGPPRGALDEQLVESLRRRAERLARSRSVHSVRLVHYARALLDEEGVEPLVRAAGGAFGDVRDALDALAYNGDGADGLADMLERARDYVKSGAKVTDVEALVDALVRAREIEAIFEQHGASRFEVHRVIAEQALERASPPPARHVSEDVFLFDEGSTKRMLAGVLEKVFEWSPTDAREGSAVAHDAGRVRAGTFPTDEARLLASRAVAHVHLRGGRLRVGCVRAVPRGTL